MANLKDKRFRSIKKSHAWISIVMFVIVSLMAAAVIGLFISTFIYYLIDMKISEEYRDVVYMSKMYEKASADGSDDIYGLLDESGRSYLIVSSDGREIHRSGEVTMSGDESTLTLSTLPEKVRVIFDEKTNAFRVGNNGGLVIDLPAVFGDLREFSASEEVDRYDEEYDLDLSTIRDNPDILYLPFWIQTDVTGGVMNVKAFITFNVKDIYLFGTIGIVAAALSLVVFIIMISNIISGIIRRRRTLNVFFTDIVTGGHNWMWFIIKGQQFLKKMKNYSARYAVLNIVFVNYRNFTVCHSIEEGEQMLVRVHRTIGAALNKREIYAHCASSDFAVVMRFTDQDALKRRVESLISSLSTIDSDHRFAFQVGITIIEPDGTPDKSGVPVRRKNLDLELEYNNACTARSALESGDESGIAFFDDKLVEDQKWVDLVQERQESALANEEFMVYYQPKYDPRTDELRGAEALIRWQSPEFGFVPPGRIIPIYEKNGFITEIDHYMIEHVAKDQKAWLDMGLKCVPVSVNVSRAHFIENDLAEQIRDMIDRVGTPHDLIEIELTESAFFDDKKAMISTIAKLKEYGFAVSMDDFGSGYSSLNSLKDMPLDVLKLDAEFFRGDNDNGRGEIVVSEAIKLAKSLNMRTVAEGVEVRDQVDFLASQGCDMIQGYYYAKPMPKNEYRQRMGTVPSEPQQA
ncbi:MAG: GGDEF domain-containing protein [Ruminiclostridium sp.]|nr:GGDEF domain-containing protein [Ruminiclostridium sp.]